MEYMLSWNKLIMS